MAKLEVKNTENKKAGSIDLSADVFEAAVKPHLFHAEVRRQLAARHAGTHSTKNRAGVSGGGAKPWKQKGTGRARQGTTRAPQWKGGGSVFGPVPRGYDFKIPKKMRKAALRGALSQRLQEDALIVIDGELVDEIKTKALVSLLNTLDLAGKSVLIVSDGENEKLELSAQNIPDVNVLRVEGINVMDVLRHEKIVIMKTAVELIEHRLGASA
jgi:large subunit ribosomal protein L4